MNDVKVVQRVVLVILGLNLLVALAKGAYGWVSGSLAVSSDALHSVLDAGSNLGALVVLRYAAQPPDTDHPYGHRKIEILAAMAIGALIAAVAARFVWTAVRALIHGQELPDVTLSGILLMVGTLVVNVFVARYEHRRGKELGSAFLVADAAHTASDVAVTIGVIIALVLSRAGVARADAIASLVVMLVIVRVAWRILSDNIGVLIDRAMIPADKVRAEALAVPGVAGCHRVRSRGITGAVQVDLHVLVDGELTVRAAHDVAHRVEGRVRKAFSEVIDVTIHVEPSDDEEEGL